jgi:hypothetical protein
MPGPLGLVSDERSQPPTSGGRRGVSKGGVSMPRPDVPFRPLRLWVMLTATIVTTGILGFVAHQRGISDSGRTEAAWTM